ncbi:MAG: 3-keto-5-aminohexanoate cleavage protein [Candidatus Latescibacterota bacterium]|nr:3-keto-5-aminohexanoate cleavage protein [Candidatus Latescibacterota bacterium]
MQDKLIISSAVCGSVPSKKQNPNVPYTPMEIANQALASWKAGAAIAHIHVRDPTTGTPSSELKLFSEVVKRIRGESDLLINLTTSGFNIDGADVGEKRLEPLELRPELCSLDVGSLNFRDGVFINSSDWVENASMRMLKMGIKPEIEIFDLGHLRQATDLIERGIIADPPWIQLCLGIRWGIEGSLRSLCDLHARLPKGAHWSALAPGALQLPITTHALLMGGHVRVGFEDNIYLSRGKLATSNSQFVERTVQIASQLQREIATCDDTRQLLNIQTK